MEKSHPSITMSRYHFFLDAKVLSPRREDAARALHMNVRMLSQRLREAGTNYSEQLYRFRLASAFADFDSCDGETGNGGLVLFHAQALPAQTQRDQTRERGGRRHPIDQIRENTPQPRNWLDMPSKFRIAYRAFATGMYDDDALYADPGAMPGVPN